MQNKIDLHLHCDGSITKEGFDKLVMMNFNLLKDEEKREYENGKLYNRLIAPKECSNLDEYLLCFDLPCRLMCNPKSVEVAFETLAQELLKQKLKYAEIRFAPQLHSVSVPIFEKLEYEEEIVKSAICGVRNVTDKNDSININIILCCMRNIPEGRYGVSANERTVYLAWKFLRKGVCAVDLAGAEGRDATSDFENIFAMAREMKIPITIHAGEAGINIKSRLDSIRKAIDFGAKRIGHGVALMYDSNLRFLVKERKIAIECCIKSNIDTKAISSLHKHPIRQFFDEGLCVTINTDNMSVSDTNLDNEYSLIKKLGFRKKEIEIMQQYAYESAFRV